MDIIAEYMQHVNSDTNNVTRVVEQTDIHDIPYSIWENVCGPWDNGDQGLLPGTCLVAQV